MEPKQNKHTQVPRRVIAAFLVLAGALSASALGASATASAVREARDAVSQGDDKRVRQSTAQEVRMNLPAVINGMPDQNIFGLEMDVVTPTKGLDQVITTNVSWLRRSELSWMNVERTEGQYDFAVLKNNGLEQEMINASQNNMRLVLIVRSTPDWAQKFPATTCGPVKPDKRAAFGNFMNALVARYSKPPFNVKYWEIWNEPDIDPDLFTPDQRLKYPFGCYGDEDDPYYGGGDFGELLKAAYPRIKAADPTAVVISGGLLLDCLPLGPGLGCQSRNPPSDPNRSKFLEGMLRVGAGDAVDIIGFHAYDNYRNALGAYGMGGYNSAWNTTGPVIHAKAAFVRSVLARYGKSNKPIMNTEGGLGCGAFSCPPDPAYDSTVAYYMPQGFAAAMAENLVANIYYGTTATWQNSNLLRDDLSPKPGFEAMKVAVVQFRGARFVQRINSYPNAHVYEFTRRGRRLWIVTSKTGGDVTLSLPATPISVKDSLGESKTPSASLTVGPNTLYVELP